MFQDKSNSRSADSKKQGGYPSPRLGKGYEVQQTYSLVMLATKAILSYKS